MSFLQSELNVDRTHKMIHVQQLDIQGGVSSPSMEACGSSSSWGVPCPSPSGLEDVQGDGDGL